MFQMSIYMLTLKSRLNSMFISGQWTRPCSSRSLNSWIWSWLNMANTLLVALWALFFVVPRRPAVFLDDIFTSCYWSEKVKEILQDPLKARRLYSSWSAARQSLLYCGGMSHVTDSGHHRRGRERAEAYMHGVGQVSTLMVRPSWPPAHPTQGHLLPKSTTAQNLNSVFFVLTNFFSFSKSVLLTSFLHCRQHTWGLSDLVRLPKEMGSNLKVPSCRPSCCCWLGVGLAVTAAANSFTQVVFAFKEPKVIRIFAA